ncbi:MAG TPA: protein kinase, partial [Terriglobales bacterium]|nr:protein kinase [Terriglobales bacterium]
LYIAMELLDGRTLQALLAERRRLPVRQAIDIVRQICAGLDFAHAKGIVHRDIKPANVMLASHGFAKITDFGIARSGEAMTLTGQVLGTPHYMSPEQVMGKSLDARSDLFSVGVILYEMLTGERPFDGQSMTTVMYKIVHETPVPPRSLDTSIHPGLSAVVEKALAKSPEMRYQSGAELVAALENHRNIDPALVATAATSALPADTTAMYTQPATPGGRYEPGPRAAGPVPGAALPPVKVPRRRASLYVLAIPLVAVLIVLSWVLYRRAEQPAPQLSTAPPSTANPTSGGNVPSAPQPSAAVATGTNSAEPSPPQTPSAPENSVSVARGASPDKETAKMTVNSSPPGAQVVVDGTNTGQTTPAVVELAKGEHTVALQLQGFQQSAAKFKVRGGEEFEFAPNLAVVMPNMPAIPQVSIPNIDLSALTGLKNMKEMVQAQMDRAQGEQWREWGASVKKGEPVIMVITSPPGASIALDKKDTGKKSPAVIHLDANGTYHVRVELPGYKPEERKVKVKEHSPGQVQFTLKRTAPEPPQPPQ